MTDKRPTYFERSILDYSYVIRIVVFNVQGVSAKWSDILFKAQKKIVKISKKNDR